MVEFVHTSFAATQTATSTSQNLSVAWPYIAVSIIIILGLVGTARRVLSNQID
jgi:hypothetical protein